MLTECSTETFDPSKIATPATFFATYRKETKSPTIKESSPQLAPVLPNIPAVGEQTRLTSSTEVAVSTVNSNGDVDVQDLRPKLQDEDQGKIQPTVVPTPEPVRNNSQRGQEPPEIVTRDLPPHLRGPKSSRHVQTVEQPVPSLLDSTPSPERTQNLEKSLRPSSMSNIEENTTGKSSAALAKFSLTVYRASEYTFQADRHH